MSGLTKYLPTDMIGDAWLIILKEVPNIEKLLLFLGYLIKQGLKNPLIFVEEFKQTSSQNERCRIRSERGPIFGFD